MLSSDHLPVCPVCSLLSSHRHLRNTDNGLVSKSVELATDLVSHLTLQCRNVKLHAERGAAGLGGTHRGKHHVLSKEGQEGVIQEIFEKVPWEVNSSLSMKEAPPAL